MGKKGSQGSFAGAGAGVAGVSGAGDGGAAGAGGAVSSGFACGFACFMLRVAPLVLPNPYNLYNPSNQCRNPLV